MYVRWMKIGNTKIIKPQELDSLCFFLEKSVHKLLPQLCTKLLPLESEANLYIYISRKRSMNEYTDWWMDEWMAGLITTLRI